MGNVKGGTNCQVCINCERMESVKGPPGIYFRCYGENHSPSQIDFAFNEYMPPEVAPEWCPHRKASPNNLAEIVQRVKEARKALEAEIRSDIPKRKVFSPKEILKIIGFSAQNNLDMGVTIGYNLGRKDERENKPWDPKIKMLPSEK